MKQVLAMPIYFNPDPYGLPLTFESIGNRWPQEPIHRPDGYPCHHWLQTERGAGEVFLCGRRLLLAEGMGLMIAPQTPHRYQAAGEWTTAFVTFAGTLAGDIGKIIGNAPFVTLSEWEGASFQAWIDAAVRRHEAQALDAAAFSVECYRMLLRLGRTRKPENGALNPLYQRYVAPVIKHIETNYAQDVTVEDLASSVYISPQYLIRLFKRFMGLSPYRYLLNARLNRAKELLAGRPVLEIQQVAAAVGYQDASHFIAAFRRGTGLTPLAFRRLHRQ